MQGYEEETHARHTGNTGPYQSLTDSYTHTHTQTQTQTQTHPLVLVTQGCLGTLQRANARLKQDNCRATQGPYGVGVHTTTHEH